MATVTLDHVTKKYGDFTAVNDLNLEIQDEEFLVLRRPVRLRQDHHAAHDRRPGGDHRGRV